ncbi:23S rRNA (uracil(1939)-C(5))-methyltransferase RlmD [Heliorestis convoluta]|uniref:23S rRNA (Uracil-5-)-methyltransferase RumA n=1 Tax=Heliorestis convoluta TaxID=356322 RepID=A0A5Q2MXR5_9FIRM|nr:23S rRNA (uracil(1939)-C(5))-methyltransferase RlmD [Heliorestis convoluta]QGG47584.1 23S rRNA (uracil-5-)-methyltransferase RumA [Heliorestis convoluta]
MKELNQADLIRVGHVDSFEIVGETLQGEGVARHNGMALFIPYTFIGDRVKAKIREVKKKYGRAELLEVIEPAQERIKAPCPVFGQCGGCQLQMMDYQRQLQLKEQSLKDTFQRLGSFYDLPIDPIVGATNPWNYRNKVQMHVTWQVGKPLQIGYYRRASRQLIEYDGCLLIPPVFSRLLKLFRTFLPAVDREKKLPIKHVLIKSVRSSSDDSAEQATSLMMILVLERWKKNYQDLCGELAQKLMKEEPSLQSFYINRNKNDKGPVLGEYFPFYLGEKMLLENIESSTEKALELQVGPASFLQVNPEQSDRLYQLVLEAAQLTGNEKVLDAYCGVGSISLYVAPHCRSVTGVEEVVQAVEDGKENALRNEVGHVEFLAGKVEELLPAFVEEGVTYDVCLLDPPRKGCSETVLAAVDAMNPQRIVYVSCDPASLVRDTIFLTQRGWSIKKVTPVDLFPQTGHLECVVLMSRDEK